MKAGSLAFFAPAVLLVTVSLSGAQQPPPLPPPKPALPPPPASLSVPDPLAGFRPGPRDLYQSPDGSDRFQHLSRYPAPPPVVPGIYFPGPYYYPSLYHHYIAETHATYVRLHDMYKPSHDRVVARGGMMLLTLPTQALVFVDGYYAGLAEEFGSQGRLLEMDAGPHRVEIRAPGYETLAFSVMISPNDVVRYRGDMQPLRTQAAVAPAAAAPAPAAAAPAAAAARVAKSVYVIPNCYAGDKPPSGTLPEGCDRKKLQTRK